MKKATKSIGILFLAVVVLLGTMVTALAAVDPALIDITKTGSLTIYKFIDQDDENARNADGTALGDISGYDALENVKFTIYKVTGWEFGIAYPTGFDTSRSTGISKTTDSDGYVVFDDLELGLYYVVEESNLAVEKAVDPFFVSIPTTNPTGTGWLYDVYVYPKNVPVEGPGIEKDVKAIGTEDAGYNVGDTVQWIIMPEVPADIAIAKKYVITDTFDYRITYDSIEKVVLGNVELENTADVTYFEAVYVAATRTLTITFTEAGREAIGAAYGSLNTASGADLPHIEIWVNTTLNDNAYDALGEAIYNQAHLDYTSNTGVHWESASDEPEVHTGGIYIFKTDKCGEVGLSGAKFKIYKDLNADGSPIYLKDPNDPNEDWVVETGADGVAMFTGLAYGEDGDDADTGATTYYLVEVESPIDTDSGRHYNLLDKPVTVIVNAASHLIQNKVVVVNRLGLVLPITGGIGVTIFVVGGLVLIAGAAALLFGRKKQKNV